MAESLELLKGTLDLLVLQTLAREPRHGYGVSESIRERTAGTLAVQDAALYQALRRLESRGHVEAEWGVSENNRRARYYRLTRQGRRHLQAELRAWQRYTAAVRQVLEPRAGES
jgi:PadR family transcriptional regulator, regulatory protein PadR